MTKLDARQVRVRNVIDYLNCGEDPTIEDVVIRLIERVQLLESAIIDYGLLVHEENSSVRIQSKSDKNS